MGIPSGALHPDMREAHHVEELEGVRTSRKNRLQHEGTSDLCFGARLCLFIIAEIIR